MPTYEPTVEFVGEKKPRAKTPLLETSLSPVESGFAGVRRSSDLQIQINDRRKTTWRAAIPIQDSVTYDSPVKIKGGSQGRRRRMAWR